MKIEIVPAAPQDVPAIRSFNERLRGGDAGFQFPESPRSLGVPAEDGAPVWHEIFVAKEGTAVRGGYALKREQLSSLGQRVELWNYQIPLSEGTINKAYATLGIRLLQDASARRPHLYSLGMGSMQRPLPRLLQRFSWKVEPVPFLFRVVRASGFLGNIEALRAQKSRRVLLDVARWSGAGFLGVLGWKIGARLRAPSYPSSTSTRDVPTFGAEADRVFADCERHYGALVDRTSAALNVRFPAGDERLLRMIVQTADRVIGWVVMTRSQLRDHKQFGNMRLGCIVDGLCDPAHAPLIIRLATERLTRENVDLIVSNQTHAAWVTGLRRNGFLSGPSNFIFARSPALDTCSPPMDQWHINRGDGDGPINL